MPYGNNKLGKYRILSTDREIGRHLPPTRLAAKDNVRAMMAAYRSVYLKPSHGTGGYGIFKLSRLPGGYLLQQGKARRSFAAFDAAFAAFAKMAGKRTYLVQKSIPLLQCRGCPFDLRVMVQKNRNREWEVTGIVARLAQKGKVVTNYHNGGRPMLIQELLLPLAGRERREAAIRSVKSLSLRTSRHLGRVFPQFAAYGVDIGLDSHFKPWIIEVNTRPDKSIFNALADKRMYRRILQYARYRHSR